METPEGYEEQNPLNMWNPEKEGDKLEGKIISENKEGTYGTQYTIRTHDGNKIMTPSHKVLQNRMTLCAVGDTVMIVFEGTEPPKVKGQNPTKIYKVFKAK